MNLFKLSLAPALCAFALVGCGGGGGGGSRPRPTTAPTPSPTTSPTAVATSQAIAFVNGGRLARINPDSGGYQLLDSGRVQSPSFSRNKSVIAYLRLISDVAAETVIIGADGAGARVVPNVPADALDVDINPAGTQIAFTTLVNNGALESLSIINTDGTNLRSISRAPILRSPVWSPDGNTLVFSQFDGDTASATGIFAISADGTGKRRLNAQENAFDFDFNPSGSTVAFTNDSGDAPVIQVMNFDGTGVRTLAINLPNARLQSPSFSPDGSRIAFAAGSASDSFLNLYTVAATGGTPAILTNSAASNVEDDAPDWR